MKRKAQRTAMLIVLALLASFVVQVYQSVPVTAAPYDVEINAINFPDVNFREYVKNADGNTDGIMDNVLSQAERDNVGGLWCDRKGIKNFKGIEHFSKLITLNAQNNPLAGDGASLDVSMLPDLETLVCENCGELYELDVSGCRALGVLMCNNNRRLTSLNLTNNNQLLFLEFRKSGVRSLTLPNSDTLKEIFCEDSELESLDLSKCTNLEVLSCQANNLRSLDVSHNTKLTHLKAFGNKLTALDLEKNVNLERLDLGTQPTDVELNSTYRDGFYEFDLSGIHDVDISRIVQVLALDESALPESASYDKNTGILKIHPSGKLNDIIYHYDVKAKTFPDKYMKVSIGLKYKQVLFNVTLNPNNGGLDAPINIPVEPNADYVLPASEFTAPTGMTFKAWEVNGSEKQPDESITVTKDIEVKALWKPETPLTMIDHVDITGVTPPAVGTLPTVDGINCATEGVVLVSGESFWCEFDAENSTLSPLESGATFEAGKQYAIEMAIDAAEGYALVHHTVLTANVNEEEADIHYYPDYLHVVFYFPPLAETGETPDIPPSEGATPKNPPGTGDNPTPLPKVDKADQPTPLPATGESRGITLWLGVALLSAGALLIVSRKKMTSKQRD